MATTDLAPRRSVRVEPRPGTWQVDASASTAGFTALELGFLRVHGSVPVASGRIEVGHDGAPLLVEADVSVRDLSTGRRKRDSDLAKPAFLDTGRHPSIRLLAADVRPTDDGWAVSGSLLVKGCATPVELDVVAVDAPDDRTVRVVATGTVDRLDAGVRAGPTWLIARDVAVRVDALLRLEG